MTSVFRCLLRHCVESPESEESDDSYRPVESNRIVRFLDPSSQEQEDVATSFLARGGENDGDESSENQENTDDCCIPGSSNDNALKAKLRDLFMALERRWCDRNQNNGEAVDSDLSLILQRVIGSDEEEDLLKDNQEKRPILALASTFDASKEVLSIGADQVVLPGSHLQVEMARAMSSRLQTMDDECVICMEGFDESNPRMPTLCGCGENKTYFHLPCLYQWIEQNPNCPSCRKKLRWEEF